MQWPKSAILISMLVIGYAGLNSQLTSPETSRTVEEGLVAYWSFEEGEGDITFDQTGNHNDGVIQCSGKDCIPSRWVDGKVGLALEFDGDDVVQVASSSSLDIIDEITIAVWIRPSKLSGDQKVAGSQSHSAGMKWVLGTLREQTYTTLVTSSGNKYSHYRFGAFVVNEWQHYAVSYKPEEGGYKVFIDGNLVGEQSTDGKPLFSNGGSMQIGASGVNTLHFEGSIDEFRIYAKALDANEIRNLYKSSI